MRVDSTVARGHTKGRKTAVSIPDDVFEQAERLARRAKKSRSQLFSDALREYVARHAPDEVTSAMDRVVDDVGTASDDLVTSAARRVPELVLAGIDIVVPRTTGGVTGVERHCGARGAGEVVGAGHGRGGSEVAEAQGAELRGDAGAYRGVRGTESGRTWRESADMGLDPRALRHLEELRGW
ncbi:MAG TPA: ribbon-helix-helix domain-containing protein [Myxococcota bacterium]|nr:ribbon-helix-helix domain-containing protein [Myxococcota bacterium]